MIVFMKKLLRPQDMLLLGFSNALDIFEEIRDPFEIMAKSYESMYGTVPRRYKRHEFNHLVWRTLKTGYIEKVIRNGIPYLRLTSSGKNKIKRDFPFLKFQASKWDKKWRVVIFDIQELTRRTRDRLRTKLKELGFGMFQQSVYISPYDIARDFAEFIESEHLDDVAYILEVSRISSGDIKMLVNKIWKLDRINEEYRELIEEMEGNDLISFNGRIKKLHHESLEEQEKIKSLIRKMYEKYLEILMRDPFLPYELLPDNWSGRRVRNIIREMMKI
jgi:phenylacetic acid degradation operon negative regulatory protein